MDNTWLTYVLVLLNCILIMALFVLAIYGKHLADELKEAKANKQFWYLAEADMRKMKTAYERERDAYRDSMKRLNNPN